VDEIEDVDFVMDRLELDDGYWFHYNCKQDQCASSTKAHYTNWCT